MSKLRQSVGRYASRAEREEGFILLAVLFLVALVLIMLAVAAPQMARSIQREKEIELVHRGEQYKRAIKLYYKKFGAYPTTIDQLVQTNNIRFLRKRYTDPITGKDDWRIIHLGQAKVPPMGLFGQPLMGLPGQAGVGTTINGPGGSTANGSAFGSPTGSSAFGPPSGSSAFGSASGSSAFGSTPVDTSNSSDSSDNGQLQLQDVPVGTGGSSVTTPGSSGSDAQSGSSAPGGANGTGSSAFGATLGGGPIVGVGIPSEKASLIEYKKQKHYNQWEFVYNPIEDQLQGALGMTGAAPGANGLGTNNPGGFGQNPGNSGSFGQSSGSDSGNSGTTGVSNPPNSDSQQQ
jgi:type II secretory pathway pseudopilin PulG